MSSCRTKTSSSSSEVQTAIIITTIHGNSIWLQACGWNYPASATSLYREKDTQQPLSTMSFIASEEGMSMAKIWEILLLSESQVGIDRDVLTQINDGICSKTWVQRQLLVLDTRSSQHTARSLWLAERPMRRLQRIETTLLWYTY
jgi:hypothetical protein